MKQPLLFRQYIWLVETIYNAGKISFEEINRKWERIVLRAYNAEPYYMRDLPLHHSQREIGQGENYVDFELMMRPTYDFCTHILSRGAQLKVLEPEWLADEIVQMHLDAIAMYDGEKLE